MKINASIEIDSSNADVVENYASLTAEALREAADYAVDGISVERKIYDANGHAVGTLSVSFEHDEDDIEQDLDLGPIVNYDSSGKRIGRAYRPAVDGPLI